MPRAVAMVTWRATAGSGASGEEPVTAMARPQAVALAELSPPRAGSWQRATRRPPLEHTCAWRWACTLSALEMGSIPTEERSKDLS